MKSRSKHPAQYQLAETSIQGSHEVEGAREASAI